MIVPSAAKDELLLQRLLGTKFDVLMDESLRQPHATRNFSTFFPLLCSCYRAYFQQLLETLPLFDYIGRCREY